MSLLHSRGSSGSVMISLALVTFLYILNPFSAFSEDGYDLWLRYEPINNEELKDQYFNQVSHFQLLCDNDICNSINKELTLGFSKMLEKPISKGSNGKLIIGTIDQKLIQKTIPDRLKSELKEEGYVIYSDNDILYVSALDERGLLYGAFFLLQTMQIGADINTLHFVNNPKVKHRLLNHWDNLDGTVERGYAGFSIWNWHQLPDYIHPRYEDYARANASVGINGSVVTNVNSNSLIFRRDYLEKTAALADIFRRYGIRIYLTARFNSPLELGELDTADPADERVQQWWKDKADEIYELIPDFGGFLVKANSEGQPGPQHYGRNHADGANLLADALAPHGGIVMWRAFVYSHEAGVDRAKQAYNEFVPLDGEFRDNVIIQVKNGPVDFQPREPIHPLFGGMKKTPVMMELQITKEYLGQGTHLVGLANMWEEIFQTNTHINGDNTVADVIDGSVYDYAHTGVAGVSNVGTDRNWTSNLFAQCDWFAFGRLAWDPHYDAIDIFYEWSALMFPNQPSVQTVAIQLLMESHQACVQYTTPLGLHHLMGPDAHYGVAPWIDYMPREDWNAVYYHKADSIGLGFDRTASGSNALEQYHPDLAMVYSDMDKCPLDFLLWFHHVPWNHELSTGNTLWQQLCLEYHEGADKVTEMKQNWKHIEGMIDEERYQSVLMHLTIQEKEAKLFRDICLTYFKSFSGMDIPSELEQPKYDLEYYQSLKFPYAPGIKPGW